MTKITDKIVDSDRSARRVGRAAMLHDWVDLAMTHFAIDPRKLQPFVPLPLDTFRGRAYVTLVPFRLTNMRCPLLPGATGALLRPVSDHRLLNVRTYVKAPATSGDTSESGTTSGAGGGGIYFLREFTVHRLNRIFAPLLYGTPYRCAHFHHDGVTTRDGTLRFTVTPHLDVTSAAPGSLDHFLLERYTAWTKPATAKLWRGRPRFTRFDIDHAPWRFRHAAVRYHDTTLLARLFPWFKDAEPVPSVTSATSEAGAGGGGGGAHACLPLRGVRIGFPTNAGALPSSNVATHERNRRDDELHPADLRALRPHQRGDDRLGRAHAAP